MAQHSHKQCTHGVLLVWQVLNHVRSFKNNKDFSKLRRVEIISRHVTAVINFNRKSAVFDNLLVFWFIGMIVSMYKLHTVFSIQFPFHAILEDAWQNWEN